MKVECCPSAVEKPDDLGTNPFTDLFALRALAENCVVADHDGWHVRSHRINQWHTEVSSGSGQRWRGGCGTVLLPPESRNSRSCRRNPESIRRTRASDRELKSALRGVSRKLHASFRSVAETQSCFHYFRTYLQLVQYQSSLAFSIRAPSAFETPTHFPWNQFSHESHAIMNWLLWGLRHIHLENYRDDVYRDDADRDTGNESAAHRRRR